MALDAVLGIAKSLVKQKIGGRAAQLTDLAERLYGRSQLSPDEGLPTGAIPGPRNWLAAARARPDPMLNVYWFCDLPAIGGGISELPWSYVEEVTLPYVEFEPVSNYRAGKMYHYAGHHSLESLQIKLYEDNRGAASSYIDRWISQIWDSTTGLYNPPIEYKKTIKITVLDTAQRSVMYYKYLNCWPQSRDNSVFTSGQTERISPTVTFNVDDVEIAYGVFDPGQIPSVIDSIGKDFPASVSNLPSVFPDVFSNVTAKFSR